jgi:hypothetical protein
MTEPTRTGAHISEEDLILRQYGEVEQPAAIDAHLKICAECRAAHDEIRAALAAVSAADAALPERGAGYGAQVWANVAPRLALGRLAWLRLPGMPRQSWALAAVLVVMLLAGFLAGRFSRTDLPPAGGAISQEARDRILLLAMGGHLERAQAMLAEIANLNGAGHAATAGPPPGVDISTDRDRAADLVAAGRIYRSSASAAGETGLELLLDELERILTDIAHAPPEITREELHAIQKRIEDRGILLKIRAIGTQVRQREKERRTDTGRTML